MDACRYQFVIEPLRGDKVVDAPSCVFLTCFETIAPPRITICEFGVEETIGVCEACLQKLGKLIALFVGETRVFTIGLGIFQVNLLVRYIEVAANHHWFMLIKLLNIGAESIVPRHAIV